MANGSNIFPLPELQGSSGEGFTTSLLSMLAAANSDESVLEDLVERAAQQAGPPPLEALQMGAATGLQPQASPVPLQQQGAVQQGIAAAVPPGPSGPQSPLLPQGPGPDRPVGARALEGLAGAREDIDKLAGTTPQTATPQARNFTSGGGVSARSAPIVPGPNAQSSAYLQSLLQLMQGNRYGGVV